MAAVPQGHPFWGNRVCATTSCPNAVGKGFVQQFCVLMLLGRHVCNNLVSALGKALVQPWEGIGATPLCPNDGEFFMQQPCVPTLTQENSRNPRKSLGTRGRV